MVEDTPGILARLTRTLAKVLVGDAKETFMNRIASLGFLLLLAGCATRKEWVALDPKGSYSIQYDQRTRICIYDDGGSAAIYCRRDGKEIFTAFVGPDDVMSAYNVWAGDEQYMDENAPAVPPSHIQELTGSNYASRCIVFTPTGSLVISDDDGDGLPDTKTEQKGLDVYHGTIETTVTTNSVAKARPAL